MDLEWEKYRVARGRDLAGDLKFEIARVSHKKLEFCLNSIHSNILAMSLMRGQATFALNSLLGPTLYQDSRSK